jgi:hypothetical protein
MEGTTMSKEELEQIDDRGMAAWDQQDSDASSLSSPTSSSGAT